MIPAGSIPPSRCIFLYISFCAFIRRSCSRYFTSVARVRFTTSSCSSSRHRCISRARRSSSLRADSARTCRFSASITRSVWIAASSSASSRRVISAESSSRRACKSRRIESSCLESFSWFCWLFWFWFAIAFASPALLPVDAPGRSCLMVAPSVVGATAWVLLLGVSSSLLSFFDAWPAAGAGVGKCLLGRRSLSLSCVAEIFVISVLAEESVAESPSFPAAVPPCEPALPP
mmetsp:Transcript_9068/g.22210  ORF Transcript_9068/g.22210 Transcript_9068/m.22210 type:complete len:232 (-) Transcript_9068:1304-1999(-)